MNKNRFKFYARRALTIFIAWVLLAMGIFIYDFIILSSNNALPANYNFLAAFIAYLIVTICAGIIGGTLTVNLMERWLRKYRFWVALCLIILAYTLVAFFVGTIGNLLITSKELRLPMFDAKVWEELPLFFGKAIFVRNYIIWLVIVILTLIFLMVGERFGPGVFPNYLKGKYFQPKRENRIFMFTDIKDATTIAEKLGEAKYFQFLKDFFRIISPAISDTQGEIYQYVGDEVVVTWNLKVPSFNLNSLLCYYEMQELIQKNENYFLEHYSTVPVFKSGFHCGPVMVGEIGYIKRDIAFSGDVLNTAARIQAKCNELEVLVLASKEFVNHILPLTENLTVVSMGDQTLKGKEKDVALVTFRNEN